MITVLLAWINAKYEQGRSALFVFTVIMDFVMIDAVVKFFRL